MGDFELVVGLVPSLTSIFVLCPKEGCDGRSKELYVDKGELVLNKREYLIFESPNQLTVEKFPNRKTCFCIIRHVSKLFTETQKKKPLSVIRPKPLYIKLFCTKNETSSKGKSSLQMGLKLKTVVYTFSSNKFLR